MQARALLFLLLLGLLSACASGPAPVLPGPKSGADVASFSAPRQWQYLVLLPAGYEQGSQSWPLVVFLHGSGERGTDVTKVAVNGPPMLTAKGKAFPFILVSPQCPDGLLWSGPEVDTFVELIARRYRVDPKRVYLTGLSMGGYGVWEAGMYNPQRYAALVPVCGGGYSADTAYRLKDIPIWAFHGGKDPYVPLAEAKEYVDAVNAAGGHAKLTNYPEAGHDCWTETYANPALYEWLLAQSRK